MWLALKFFSTALKRNTQKDDQKGSKGFIKMTNNTFSINIPTLNSRLKAY